MNTLTERFGSPLKPFGVAAGTFLVLAALGTIAGAPWTTHATMASAVLQVVGAVLMAIVGAGLAYLTLADGE
ncbi:hypothetical protein EGH21_14620 [Halomicroarcula sp. F13]|uniref:DUF8123 domain-containing protein n=1 Tax=Haloarcula rubra TaxID=2487747 RepID=A0AAW4PV87_9EURY|nr:hypothetical protein [Halomicroarcula rubra]MBX0324268.1 hypothetical protein [Halomicroarcula rubra]